MSLSRPKLAMALRPMIPDDIATCAQIAGLAFETDRQTQFKAANPAVPYDHESGMRTALAAWVSESSATARTSVVVDDSANAVLGWMAWAIRDPARESSVAPLSVNRDSTEHKASRAALEDYTNKQFEIWIPRLMPQGSRCVFIRSIVVDPKYHGQGIGKLLVSQMLSFADERGMSAWVQSSQGGEAFFRTMGFETLGATEVDLDAWNSEALVPPKGVDVGWGKYRLPWMKRDGLTR